MSFSRSLSGLFLFLACALPFLQAQQPIFKTSTFSTSGLPFLVVSGDMNGDSKPDLVVAGAALNSSTATGAIDTFLNDGKANFRKASTLTPPNVPGLSGDGTQEPCIPFFIAVGDFVKDGKNDLLVACSFSSVVLVYPGNGDGTYGSYILSTAPTGVLALADELKLAIGDFNNDGFLDFAFTEVNQSQVTDDSTPLTGPVAVILGNGTGKFFANTSVIRPTTAQGATIAAGNLNNDKNLDLVISQPKNLTLSIFSGLATQPGSIQILLGKGDGTFTTGQLIQVPFAPGPVTLADVNGDGKLDLVVDGFLNGLAVYLGNGDGTFKQSFNQNVGSGTVGSAQVVDLTGSGKPGLLIPVANCCSNQVIFLPGNGDGTFQNYVPINTGIASPEVIATDFDGDGKPDLALVTFFVGLQQLGGAILGGAVPTVNFTQSLQIELNSGIGPIVTYANGASFANGTLAAGSIVSAFGSGGMAAATDTPSVLPLPTTDQGSTISVKDSLGSPRNAALFYVSPTQINFQIPDLTAAGPASITLSYLGQTYTTQQTIAAVAPGIFQANPTTHLLSGDVTMVHSDGSRTASHTYQLDAANNVVPSPISLGLTSDQVFITFYGTGLKNAKAVTATISGTSIPVAFFGPQGTFVGLDQVNVGPLPQSLAGKGAVNLTLSADTIAASAVTLTIQ